MKIFTWSPEKNQTLRRERNITFEEVLFHLERGDVLDILEHPNASMYPGQNIFVINVDGYAMLVPFVESDDEVFLKTIIPSRKATRIYLKDKP